MAKLNGGRDLQALLAEFQPQGRSRWQKTELPTDCLKLAFKFLIYKDQSRAQTACKRWRSVGLDLGPVHLRLPDTLPMLSVLLGGKGSTLPPLRKLLSLELEWPADDYRINVGDALWSLADSPAAPLAIIITNETDGHHTKHLNEMKDIGETLARFTSLRSLSLSVRRGSEMQGDDLDFLTQMPQLRILKLVVTCGLLRDTHLAHIGQLKMLTSLHLDIFSEDESSRAWTFAGFDRLATLALLENLHFVDPESLHPSLLTVISHFPALTSYSASGYDLQKPLDLAAFPFRKPSDQGKRGNTPFAKLQVLTLRGAGLTLAQLGALTRAVTYSDAQPLPKLECCISWDEDGVDQKSVDSFVTTACKINNLVFDVAGLSGSQLPVLQALHAAHPTLQFSACDNVRILLDQTPNPSRESIMKCVAQPAARDVVFLWKLSAVCSQETLMHLLDAHVRSLACLHSYILRRSLP